MRRLTLARETLGDLTPTDLASVVGAADPLALLTTLGRPTRRTCFDGAADAERNSLLCIPTTTTDSFRAC